MVSGVFHGSVKTMGLPRLRSELDESFAILQCACFAVQRFDVKLFELTPERLNINFESAGRRSRAQAPSRAMAAMSSALALGSQPIDLSQVGPRIKTGPQRETTAP